MRTKKTDPVHQLLAQKDLIIEEQKKIIDNLTRYVLDPQPVQFTIYEFSMN